MKVKMYNYIYIHSIALIYFSLHDTS